MHNKLEKNDAPMPALADQVPRKRARGWWGGRAQELRESEAPKQKLSKKILVPEAGRAPPAIAVVIVFGVGVLVVEVFVRLAKLAMIPLVLPAAAEALLVGFIVLIFELMMRFVMFGVVARVAFILVVVMREGRCDVRRHRQRGGSSGCYNKFFHGVLSVFQNL